ncbi:MAG TPA: 2Fe-2S iron-sulfur cluster-binding protein [Steroidobacteraceae bacterium]|nr:2Fe-2S iron-sulfur cluster-binding protein [Steroidobacteraceae bacterium]
MTVRLEVDGRAVEVPDGATVAAAVALVSPVFGRSSRGAPRAPLCGMGVCFECRLTIDGVPGRRACIEPARAGMQVRTHE